jgi:N-acetylmuramoyl-L-alanine amidase
MILLVQTNFSLTHAAVHVSSGGDVFVTKVTTQSIIDVSGNAKLRVILDLSGPYVSEYSCSTVFSGYKSVSSIKFDNLLLRASLDRTVQLDGKIADTMLFEEGNETLTLRLDSSNDSFGDSTVNVMARSRTDPWRIVVDLPVQPRSDYDYQKIAPGINGKTIVIDPGHGGSDTGAIGPSGVREKDVNLLIALQLKNLLVSAGARVVMTRDRDVDCSYPKSSDEVELSARVAFAKKYNPDIFISLHNDAYYNRASNGTATYYFVKSERDALLARAIQRCLQRSVGLTDKGIRKANFYVLRNTKMPAALVEVAFISNINEEKLLVTPIFQQKAALGIFDGINDYFSGR